MGLVGKPCISCKVESFAQIYVAELLDGLTSKLENLENSERTSLIFLRDLGFALVMMRASFA